MAFERVKIEPHTKTYMGGDVWRFSAWVHNFNGRKRPLPVYITAPRKYLSQVKTIKNLLSLVSVQRQLCKDLKIREGMLNQIDRIEISTDFNQDLKTLEISRPSSSQHGIIERTIKLSFFQAQHLRGDKLAWVLGGGSTRGFAYPWIFKSLESLGLKPDFIYGTSSGAAFGAMYSLFRKAMILIDLAKVFNKNFNWQDCLDVNISGLKDRLTYMAPLRGQYLKEIMETLAGFKKFYYSDLKIPLFSVSINLNSGQPKIFCDPKFKGEMLYDHEEIVDHDYRIANGMMATCSIPGIMPPFNINRDPVKDNNGKFVNLPPEMHVDGGLYENVPVKAALRNPEVGEIVAVHLGYSGELRHNINNFLQIVPQALGFASIPQLDILESNKTEGVQIRVFNPRFFKLDSLSGLEKAQRIGLSASNGMKNIISRIMNGRPFDKEIFFSPLTPEQIEKVEEIAKVKEYRPNSVYFEEIDPLVDHPDSPEMMQLMADDGGEVIPKPVGRSARRWFYDQMAEQLGWPRATLLAGDLSFQELILKLLF
jgi:predicted acylesterase/phospholipase RssA